MKVELLRHLRWMVEWATELRSCLRGCGYTWSRVFFSSQAGILRRYETSTRSTRDTGIIIILTLDLDNDQNYSMM